MSAEGEDMILEKVPCHSYEEMLREVHAFLPLSFCVSVDETITCLLFICVDDYGSELPLMK